MLALVLASLTLLTLALAPLDAAITKFVSEALAPHASWLRRLLRLARIPTGMDNIVLPAPEAYLLLGAALLGYAHRARLLIGFGVPILAGTALVQLIKHVVGRARPELSPDFAFRFEMGSFGTDGLDAFPSGHATSAAIFATLLGIYFPRVAPWIWPLVPLACLSRVAQARHWPSDVVAGVLLGICVVLACRQLLGPRFYALSAVDSRPERAPQAAAALAAQST